MDATSLTVVALTAVVLVAGLAFWISRRKWLRGQAAEYHHFRCPNCQRRLRFLAGQVGHKGECSNCGNPVTFPPAH